MAKEHQYPWQKQRSDSHTRVNPAELAAQTNQPEGWPELGVWPRDKWYYWCGGWLDHKRIDEVFGDWKRGDPIGYVRDEAPFFEVPRYEGERYEAMVPDTLDIQERTALGVHAVTEQTDPDADYELYGNVQFSSNPPVLLHDACIRLLPKWMEALILCRLISGS